MSRRPLVVLGGWLGCQPRWLKRYEDLYKSLGFDVLSYIATPRQVVHSTLDLVPAIEVPPQWPVQIPEESESMQQLAWHLLGNVHNKQPPAFLFHAFSNGGCFLWENTRRILDVNINVSCSQPEKEILKALRGSLKGVIFDSCPAWMNPGGLRAALQFCPPIERLELLMRFGPGVILYDGQETVQKHAQRNCDLFKFLREDPLDIPQLYLYCKNDPLSDFQKIDDLFQYRHSTQKSSVMQHRWDESTHCAHLRIHPIEYVREVKDFADISLLRPKL